MIKFFVLSRKSGKVWSSHRTYAAAKRAASRLRCKSGIMGLYVLSHDVGKDKGK